MKRYVVLNGEGCVLEGIRPDGSVAMDFEPKHPLLFHSAEMAYRTAAALHAMSHGVETFLVAEREVPAAERADADVCTDSGTVSVDVTRHPSDYAPFHSVEVELMCLPERRGGRGKRNPGNRPWGGPPTWRDGR